jgi:hypothetical protein
MSEVVGAVAADGVVGQGRSAILFLFSNNYPNID